MTRPFLPLALAVLIAGCAGIPDLPPKESPDEVEVYNANVGEQPRGRYRPVAEIQILRPVGTSNAEVVRAAQEEAARIGADAIIIHIIRRSTQGEIEARGQEEIVLEAMAIYWPDRERG